MLRRNFLKLSAATFATAMYSRLTYATSYGDTIINTPDEAWAQVNGLWIKLSRSNGSVFNHQDIQVSVKPGKSSQAVFIQSPSKELEAVRLKWNYNTSGYTNMLGDHWERSYGDLAWKTPEPEIKNPWYVLLHDQQHTACFGIKTGAGTICWWAVKTGGIELTLDTLSGGTGVKLGQRELHAADIVTTVSRNRETPFATATRFCKMMCATPRLPKQPVYGINDWYAVYGKNSFETIKEQTAFMAGLITHTGNRPFSVIDDGWQQSDDFSKPNEKFKDMHAMAGEIKKTGMRPGLWMRPLIAKKTDSPNLLAPKIPGRQQNGNELILDPTVPETTERIKANMALYRQWGYDMVKHDFSSSDIFGRWGFQMKDQLTATGWKFYDQSKTNAEIINHLYRSIRDAAGDVYIIGCNTMSHLSAGLFEIYRTGDDTSGKEWERTKKMGVNTLGFRLPQHNTFYAADGDCVGLTSDVPWDKNRQWLQLLAESGAPLFISAQLNFMGKEQQAAVKTAFAQAATVQPTGEPLDWMTNPWPSRWHLNNRQVVFNWD